MKILKFGGTSLGSIENLHKVKDILKNDVDRKMIVCSAMAGVTDQLISISESSSLKDVEAFTSKLHELKEKHINILYELIDDHHKREEIKEIVFTICNEISALFQVEYTETVHSRIITYGELLLTQIFSSFLNHIGISNIVISAEEFMWVDCIENPNVKKVSKKLASILENSPTSQLYITQGFVCRNSNGDIDTLRRGGSDYSATIIGAALDATEVQIWTDIDGVHNNDPRYVNDTYSIPYLSYNEASELAYFGAKVLHPQTIFPVIDTDISIVLKDTTNQNAVGTIISNNVPTYGLKGVSAKDDITAITIKSKKGVTGYDFLKQVFDIFYRYQTTIDMVTTTEKSISLAIETTDYLSTIVREIDILGEVTVAECNSIISIVGETIIYDKNSYKLFEVLNHISVKMISFGNSRNISILVDTCDKVSVLRFLHKKLFLEQSTMTVM